jgi:3-oxoacid CoA-transferase subunit A
MLSGELDVELTPQGTLAEKCRCTSRNTFLHTRWLRNRSSRGKEVREFNGKMHIMELAYKADFAAIAWKGDEAET